MKQFKTGKRGRLQSDVPEGVCLEHGPGRRPDRWQERHCWEVFFVSRIVRCGEGLQVRGGGKRKSSRMTRGQMAGTAVGEGMVSLGEKWLFLARCELWDTSVEPSGWLELELKIKAGSHRECKWTHGHMWLPRRASEKGRGPRNPCASEGWTEGREGRRSPTMRKKTTERDARMPQAECGRTNRLRWWMLLKGQVAGFPRQGSCDLPGSSVSAVVKPWARPYGCSISNHILLSRLTPGVEFRGTSGLAISLQSVAQRFQSQLNIHNVIHSRGFGCFYFNTEWASLGT